MSSPTSTVPTVRASGAISGVLGAYLVLFPAARIITLVPVLFIPFFFEIPAVLFLGIWFVGQLSSGTLSLMSTQTYEGVARMKAGKEESQERALPAFLHSLLSP